MVILIRMREKQRQHFDESSNALKKTLQISSLLFILNFLVLHSLDDTKQLIKRKKSVFSYIFFYNSITVYIATFICAKNKTL